MRCAWLTEKSPEQADVALGNDMNMQIEPSQLDKNGVDLNGGRIRVWHILGRAFQALFRNIVPFLVLALGVGFAVKTLLSATEQLVVASGLTTDSGWSHTLITSTVLNALSSVPVEAAIALAVWLDLQGRRLTLKEWVVSVVRAIPGALHPPFRALVATVFTVSLFRAAIFLPLSILLVMSGQDPSRQGILFLALAVFSIMLDTLVDSRLLVLIPVAAVERIGIVDSFKRCWHLTSGHWPQVLGVVVLFLLLSSTVTSSTTFLRLWWPLPWLLTSPRGSESGLRSVLAALGRLFLLTLTRLLLSTRLATAFVRSYQAVMAAVCYHRLRIANGETVSGETIARQTV